MSLTPPSDWNDAQKVLAIRLDAMGDVLMTGPALRALKELHPARRVTLLTSPSGAEAARLMPGLDEVIVYAAPWIKATPIRTDSEPDLRLIRRLRQARFDAAVIFTVFSQNPMPAVLLSYLANVPRRLAHCRENPYQLLTHWVREPDPEHGIRHEVRRQLDLVASVGCRPADERMRIVVPAEARCWASKMACEQRLGSGKPWLLLHPGSSAPSRRYPPEQYVEAGKILTREHDFKILVTGSASERELVDQVCTGIGAGGISLVEQLDLPRLAALIALAPLVLTNNTGPAHLAASLQTPVVDLYALTNPQHTPWRVPCRVLSNEVSCKYCYKSVCPEGHQQCLRGISPAAVAEAVLDLWNTGKSSARARPLNDRARFAYSSPLPLVKESRGAG